MSVNCGSSQLRLCVISSLSRKGFGIRNFNLYVVQIKIGFEVLLSFSAYPFRNSTLHNSHHYSSQADHKHLYNPWYSSNVNGPILQTHLAGSWIIQIHLDYKVIKYQATLCPVLLITIRTQPACRRLESAYHLLERYQVILYWFTLLFEKSTVKSSARLGFVRGEFWSPQKDWGRGQ